MPCPRWPEGVGNHWLVLGLLLLCIPSPGPTLAFPNDVLAKLSELHKHAAQQDSNSSSLSSAIFSYSPHSDSVPMLGKPVSSPASHSAVSDRDSANQALLTDKSARTGEERDSFYSEHYDTDDDNDIDSQEASLLTDQHRDQTSHTDQYGVSGNPDGGREGVTDGGAVDSHRHGVHDSKSPDGGEGEGEARGHRTQDRPSPAPVQTVDNEQTLLDLERGSKGKCDHCKVRDGDRRYRLESIKRQILKELHLSAPPNLTGVNTVPKAIEHVADIQLGDLMQDAPYGGYSHHGNYDDDDDYYSAPERVFTVAKPLPGHLSEGSSGGCYFNIPPEVVNRPIQKANLWFHVSRPSLIQSTVIEMRVFRLGPLSKRLHPARRVVWSQKAYPEKAVGWKRVDVTALVRRWARHPSSNYGLEIEAMNDLQNLVVLPGLASESERGYEPLLDIKVVDDHKRRYKRSEALTCTENSTEHRCCRYPLHVSFAEFGWDWVIAPTHVKADYCSGECRMTLQDQTPHSWVASQTLEGGGSCCTPSKMSALPLLYFDQNGNVVFQMLQNMKIERCGCA